MKTEYSTAMQAKALDPASRKLIHQAAKGAREGIEVLSGPDAVCAWMLLASELGTMSQEKKNRDRSHQFMLYSLLATAQAGDALGRLEAAEKAK